MATAQPLKQQRLHIRRDGNSLDGKSKEKLERAAAYANRTLSELYRIDEDRVWAAHPRHR